MKDHRKESREFQNMYMFIWALLRLVSANDKVIPILSGWGVQKRCNIGLVKTVLTYLPPLNAPITEFSTIYKLFEILQARALQSNMPYVNLTFDVGAVINGFRVLWNYQTRFSNIVLHLGDFHFMKEVFSILGKLISGSGFEDIIFQADICSTGSLNSVLSGSHYNRGWTVHGILAEALERLSFKMFVESTLYVPPIVRSLLLEQKANEQYLDILEGDDEVKFFLARYEAFKGDVRNGLHGKTAQFWTVYYLDIMSNLHMTHYSVQTNNYNLRLEGLKNVLPFCFALNKQKYARYGSIYINSLQNLDDTHDGCKELLKEKELDCLSEFQLINEESRQ